jgi:hypothetical protein
MMLPIALCLMLAWNPGGGAAPGGTPNPSPHRVRTMSDGARTLLADAVVRSATIARLVQSLQEHRVFVFVDTRIDPAVPTGQTVLLTANDAGRYVQIVLNPALTWDRRIELLGHELQHALEIATADDVHDGPSLRRHFASIGRELNPAARTEQSYETDAARDVEVQVRRDLRRYVGI